jgi:hypothetical protein
MGPLNEFISGLTAPINAIGSTINNVFSGFADLFGAQVDSIKDELSVLRDEAALDEERMNELGLQETQAFKNRKKRSDAEIKAKKKAAVEE